MENVKKLLFVDCCISAGESSRTKRLCEAFIDALGEGYETEHFEVNRDSVYALDSGLIKLRDRLIDEQDYSGDFFKAARLFAAADIIVVGAPFWDCSFPSLLKEFIEDIMVRGLTFRYTGKGPVGLCRAANLVYVTTIGGYCGESNSGYEYIKQICGAVGIKKCAYLEAAGLDINGADVDAIMNEAIERGKAAALLINNGEA